MGDFSKKQPAPQGVEPGSRPAHNEGGEPTTGFVQAPLTAQDRGGLGEAIPPSNKKIR